jgi:type IV secretory pathway TrbD component
MQNRRTVRSCVSQPISQPARERPFQPSARVSSQVGRHGIECQRLADEVTLHLGRDNQSAFNQRVAASAVSSGLVLNAIAAFGVALWTAFTTVSNKSRLFGGSRRPPPITTQS